MQSAEDFEYSIEKCFERESDGCYIRDDPREDATKLIAARDAEWQARVDKLEAALNGLLRCWDLVCDTHDWDPNHLNEVLAARAALGREV